MLDASTVLIQALIRSPEQGGVVIFIRGSFLCKLCNDLSIYCEDIESLSIEILNSQTRNITFNGVYRPPDGNLNVCETFFKKILSDSTTVNKAFSIAGDFRFNLHDFETNKKVKCKLNVNLMSEFSMIPTINKPTRVTKYTATAIDYFITNSILSSQFKSAIVETDLSNDFPIIFINEFKGDPTNMEKYIYKRNFNENAFNCFKQALLETSWNSVKNLKQTN